MVLGTSSKKEQIKRASAGHLSAFKKIISGLTATNKQIVVEKQLTTKRIKDLNQDLSDYDQIEKENSNVIEGLNGLLGINKVKSN